MTSSEMLSGPDLGGGLLHQLTIDREGDRTGYTFHAQDGGADAGGPSKGPPEPFGYRIPPTACTFGGPRCWHREFRLGEAEAPRVRMAYNRMRFVMAPMLEQRYGRRPPTIDAALEEIAGRLSEPARGPAFPWYVGGSTASYLLGAAIAPEDIDLGTTREGIDRIASALSEYLIEPAATTDWPRVGEVYAARAFVGTVRDGARVEWAHREGVPSTGPGEWTGDLARVRTEPVDFHGFTLRVTRPEYALLRAAEAGRHERIEPLVATLRTLGTDASLLEELLGASTLPAPARDALLARCVA
ncbi:MAG: hypothetical protein HKL79_01650 [Thermoplasmata archaeon]|nr:hypothetical protein [Thermoplasmata archaeon]